MMTPLPRSSPTSRRSGGFSLLEVLVAAAVMVVMMALMASVVGMASRTIRASSDKVDAFQGARTGFDTVTRNLSQATLNTYWDYFNNARQPRTPGNAANFQPALYGRQSDLHFLATDASTQNFPLPSGLEASGHALFFQTPLGYPSSADQPPGTLNASGFFVAYGDDPTHPTVGGLANRPRFRLYQWLQPSADLRVDPATGVINPAAWVSPNGNISPLAENIVAFVARVPEESASTPTNYSWDSRPAWGSGNQPSTMHQLPPLVEVTMVAVDESSAARLLQGVNSASAAAAALGLPAPGTVFTDPAKYEEDLAAVQNGLASKGVSYRTFRTAVPLRGSKWSPSMP